MGDTRHQVALARIEAEKTDRTGCLNLSGLGLESLPEAIRGLDHLRQLDCSGNYIDSLEPLSVLKQLTELNCGGNDVVSLDPLSGVKQLRRLNCNGNQIASLEPLLELKQLTILECLVNQIPSLAPLSGLEQLTMLVCSDNQIAILDPLSGLKQLTELFCSSNQITSLEPLSGLKQLTVLECSENQIISLEGLSELRHLAVLHCSENHITSLDPLSGLTQLTELVFFDNEVASLRPLSELKQLAILHCIDNFITSLGPLAELNHLTELECSDNQITSLEPLLGLKQLTELVCDYNRLSNDKELAQLLVDLPNLTKASFTGNWFEHLPTELLGGGYPTEDCVTNLRAYFQDCYTGTDKNRRLKVLLMGNGRVGKTSLARCLAGESPSEGEASTHGIFVEELKDVPSEGWTLNLWDFGGQEIYHATHRLFYASNALYLVLWAEVTNEADDEHNHPLRYWLDLVNRHTTGSSVLIVKNQIDRSDTQGAIPSGIQHSPYASLPAVKVSALKERRISLVFEELREMAQQIASQLPQLPLSWGLVMERLTQVDEPYISYEAFTNLCPASVSQPEALLSYLHRTGDVFDARDALEGRIILDQNWVIQAVYLLFDPRCPPDSNTPDPLSPRQEIERAQGQVIRQKLEQIYQQEAAHPYTPKDVGLFLAFMEKSQMCFRLNKVKPDAEHDTYVLPALLPMESPIGLDALWELRISYPWLHRLVIERLIIKTAHLSPKQQWWRNGIVISDNRSAGQALLEARTESQSLHIFLSQSTTPEFLERIRRTVTTLQECLPTEETIRCLRPEPSQWILVSALSLAAKHGRDTVPGGEEGLGEVSVTSFQPLFKGNMRLHTEETLNDKLPYDPSLKGCYIEKLEVTNVMGNVYKNKGNMVGSAMGGTGHSITFNGNITIGETQEKRQQQIESIDELLNALETDGIQQAASKHIRQFWVLKSELLEQEPDPSWVQDLIKGASGILSLIDRSYTSYQKALAVLASFGLTVPVLG